MIGAIVHPQAPTGIADLAAKTSLHESLLLVAGISFHLRLFVTSDQFLSGV